METGALTSQLFYLRHHIGNLDVQTAVMGLEHSTVVYWESACKRMAVYGDFTLRPTVGEPVPLI